LTASVQCAGFGVESMGLGKRADVEMISERIWDTMLLFSRAKYKEIITG
jgi:hypothetical protein